MSRATRPATPPFLYLAATAAGKRSLGMRQARSERALAAALRKDRKVLLKSWRLPAALSSTPKLTLKDHAVLNEQMHQLLSRGVPLVETLEVCAQTVSPKARGIVEGLKDEVAAGAAFSSATRASGSFDTVTAAIYAAAERTGDLAGAAEQLAQNARRQLAVSGKAATLMIYPAIVFAIGVIVSVVMLTWLVPRIGGALEGAGLDLPAFTRAVMGVGLALRENWLIVLGLLAALVVAGVVGRVWVAGALGRLARKVPGLRGVLLAQESARFFSVMAAMSRAGVPLAEGLGVSIHAIGDPKLKGELVTVRDKLVQGGVLRRLLEEVLSFPLATRRLLIAADRAGDLESAFSALADDMAVELDKRSSRLLAALEPLLLVLLFLAIGTLMMSVMVPLLTATSGMI